MYKLKNFLFKAVCLSSFLFLPVLSSLQHNSLSCSLYRSLSVVEWDVTFEKCEPRTASDCNLWWLGFLKKNIYCRESIYSVFEDK